MDPIGALLGLAVLFGVVAIVLRPLLLGPSAGQAQSSATGRRSARARHLQEQARLLQQRNEVYAAIKELDFEHETSKVSDEEHARQRADLVQQGIAILKQLDALEASAPADDPLEAVIASVRGGAASEQIAAVVSTDIEDQIAALRGGAATNGHVTCPVCNTRVGPEDRFCGHCGQELAVTVALNCPECGTPRQPGDQFCARCGTVLPTPG